MNQPNTGMKIVFVVVLLLIILPLALFALLRIAPPIQDAPASAASGKTAESAESARTGSGRVATRERRDRNEARTAVREETTVVEPEEAPEPGPNWEIGAISPNATHFKKASPYPPGEVPGDSGLVVQYAGSPDDMVSGPLPPVPSDDMMNGPQPPVPADDPWGGRTLPPISPENMRGIGGVRRVDPNDPFFRQPIVNPFAD